MKNQTIQKLKSVKSTFHNAFVEDGILSVAIAHRPEASITRSIFPTEEKAVDYASKTLLTTKQWVKFREDYHNKDWGDHEVHAEQTEIGKIIYRIYNFKISS